LQAEGREGGEAAANADHDEKARGFRDRVATLRQRQRADEADDERAQNIDADRAPWQ
jgi:hypothetical protein